jgi:hypothetical protein
MLETIQAMDPLQTKRYQLSPLNNSLVHPFTERQRIKLGMTNLNISLTSIKIYILKALHFSA